ncbi:hypothetical protein GG344DRAFT_16710, partial [Lentinula edodes]
PNTLDRIRKMTYDPREGETITPFTTTPWRRTEPDWKGRLTTLGTLGQDKAEAAKEHKHRMQNISKLDSHLVVYSDGSQQQQEGRLITGYGFVGYRQGREVFSRMGGMGSTAEVYDAEMAGLAHGAAK